MGGKAVALFRLEPRNIPRLSLRHRRSWPASVFEEQAQFGGRREAESSKSFQEPQPEWTFNSGDVQSILRPTAAAVSDAMGFLLHSSMAGSGVALLPAYVCQLALAAGRLVALLPGWNIPPYEMKLIFPNLKNQSKPQAAFRGYVNTFDFSAFAVGR
ncbi:MAG: hypothetical protein HC869_11085 [Rhodospirillales bacterium]|nr:hypothetical protein [Rhodospirillales bacterium]